MELTLILLLSPQLWWLPGRSRGPQCAQVHSFSVGIRSVLLILEVKSRQGEGGRNHSWVPREYSIGNGPTFETSPLAPPQVRTLEWKGWGHGGSIYLMESLSAGCRLILSCAEKTLWVHPLAFAVHCGYLVGVGWGVYFKVTQAGNCFDNVNALNMRHYLIPLFSIPFLLPNTTELCTRTPLCLKWRRQRKSPRKGVPMQGVNGMFWGAPLSYGRRHSLPCRSPHLRGPSLMLFGSQGFYFLSP